NNSYRYYDIEKFEELDFIRYMRYLNISIADIKKIMAETDITSYKDTLNKQLTSIEEDINKLKAIKGKINQRLSDVELVSDKSKINIIEIKKIDKRYAFQIIAKIENDEELNFALSSKGRELKSNSLIIGNVAVTISRDDLRSKKYGIYNGLLIFNHDSKAKQNIIIKEGLFCCKRFQGGHSDAAVHYKDMYEYIHSNGYAISGYAIERTCANHMISSNIMDYVTEIQIPIERL
ncbi:MAG: GyrI-like domain-containing protein, partial [Clostridiales bacterium]|nr:GyrI-like domain-containing protein [Clostridiales bacterium]